MRSVSWIDPGLHNGPDFPKKSRRWVHNHSFEIGSRNAEVGNRGLRNFSIVDFGIRILDLRFRFAQSFK